MKACGSQIKLQASIFRAQVRIKQVCQLLAGNISITSNIWRYLGELHNCWDRPIKFLILGHKAPNFSITLNPMLILPYFKAKNICDFSKITVSSLCQQFKTV